jgi:hypothetical protein
MQNVLEEKETWAEVVESRGITVEYCGAQSVPIEDNVAIFGRAASGAKTNL